MQETLYGNVNDASNSLEEGKRKQTTPFYCIQIKSAPAWGIQSNIMEALCTLELDVIDHRSWHPRQSTELLINEIYVKDACAAIEGKERLDVEKIVDDRIPDIMEKLKTGSDNEMPSSRCNDGTRIP